MDRQGGSNFNRRGHSDINSVFYGVGFHRFIANILYVELVARGAGAEEIFGEFETLMRNQDLSSLQSIFSTSIHPENSPIVTQIREFAQLRAADIYSELDGMSKLTGGKFILDLSHTALYTLLANWGETFDQITAICDDSKSLKETAPFFEPMIGRTERVHSDLFGKRHPITFNLDGPIQFANSKLTYGIQVADVVAAAAVYVASGANDEHADKWRGIIAKIGGYASILPDNDEVNLKSPRAQLNAVLLMELHDRAKLGLSLIEGMPEYIQLIARRLGTHPLRMHS